MSGKALYALGSFVGVILTMGSGMLVGVVLELVRIHEISEALRLFAITLALCFVGGTLTVFCVTALARAFGGRRNAR